MMLNTISEGRQMKVILLQDVKGVGKKGQTVEVSDGYANNFILPRRLGVMATKRSQEILNLQIEDARKKDEENRLSLLSLLLLLVKMDVCLVLFLQNKLLMH